MYMYYNRKVIPSMATGKKKQVPLRLSEDLYQAIAAWAEAIEYLLTECVRQRKKTGGPAKELDIPPDLDLH